MLLSDFPEDILDIISSFHYSVFYNLCLTVKWYSIYKSHPLEQKRFKKYFTYIKTLSRDDQIGLLNNFRSMEFTSNTLRKINNTLKKYYDDNKSKLISRPIYKIKIGKIKYIKYKYLAGNLHSTDDSNSVILFYDKYLLTFRHQFGKLESYQHNEGCLEPAVSIIFNPYHLQQKVNNYIEFLVYNDKLYDTISKNDFILQEFFINDKPHNHNGPSLISKRYNGSNYIYKEYKRFGEYHHPLGISKGLKLILKNCNLFSLFDLNTFRKPSVIVTNGELIKECRWNYNNGDLPNVIIPVPSYQRNEKYQYYILKWLSSDRELHRENGPAVLNGTSIGSKEWYLNGKRHRDNDLPAVTHLNGYKAWYQNGKLHRGGGLPALERADGSKFWYNLGDLYKSLEFNRSTRRKPVEYSVPEREFKNNFTKKKSLGYVIIKK